MNENRVVGAEPEKEVEKTGIAAIFEEEMRDAPQPTMMTTPVEEEMGEVKGEPNGEEPDGEKKLPDVVDVEVEKAGGEETEKTEEKTEGEAGEEEKKEEKKEKKSKKKRAPNKKKKEGAGGEKNGRGGSGRQRSPTPKAAVAAAEGEDGMTEEIEEKPVVKKEKGDGSGDGDKCIVTCAALTSRTQTQCKRPPLSGGVYCKVHQEAANKSENGIKNYDPNAVSSPPPPGKEERPTPTLTPYVFPDPPKPTLILKQPFAKWINMKVQLEAGSHKGVIGRITKIYGGVRDEYSRESGLINADVYCEITLGNDDEEEEGNKKKKNQYMTKITTTRQAKELTPIIKNERGRGMRKVKKSRKIEVVEEEIVVPEDPQPKRIKMSGLGTGKKKGLPGWEDPEPGVSPYANKFIRIGEKFQCNVPTMKRFHSQGEYTGERNTLGGNVKAHWKSAFKRNEIDRVEKEDKNYKGGIIWDPKCAVGDEGKRLFEGYSTTELDEIMRVYREEKAEGAGEEGAVRSSVARHNNEKYFSGFVDAFEGRPVSGGGGGEGGGEEEEGNARGEGLCQEEKGGQVGRGGSGEVQGMAGERVLMSLL
ncbi:hypothetical protein TL16_g01659 [Triparma laevis f. inornata]|uniref:Uncharacterized protein n=1 Tax=Triparma laevis f. inornata TaxID=1714386 RepID=A0A9W6ZPT3_9STRA|nr:hypothetical protein TL16_g01659 [Triparma laevis f. inornata]